MDEVAQELRALDDIQLRAIAIDFYRMRDSFARKGRGEFAAVFAGFAAIVDDETMRRDQEKRDLQELFDQPANWLEPAAPSPDNGDANTSPGSLRPSAVGSSAPLVRFSQKLLGIFKSVSASHRTFLKRPSSTNQTGETHE